MAKNWKPGEAVKEIKEKNKSAIVDIGRRFPLFVEAVASNDLEAILAAMPEHMTVRKIESALKENVPDFVDDEEVEAEEEEVKKAPAAKAKRTRKPVKKVEEDEEDEEIEDEEDEEEVKPTPSKRGRKATPKSKATKKKVVEEDEEEEDDEDWDI